ncbi:MAG: arginine deiminase family protein [Oscillibacter sp.]
MKKFNHVIVRRPCKAMVEGITSGLYPGKPDYALALKEHDSYIEALKQCDVDVTVLEADERYPDSCFVEDPALITSKCAIITNPGAASRNGEKNEILGAIRKFFDDDHIEYIKAPGTLEGGDVMMVGDHFYVGRSARTNEEGIRQLTEILAKYGLTCSEVTLEKVLHLKTGVNYLENNNMLVSGEFVTKPDFEMYHRVEDPGGGSLCSQLHMGQRYGYRARGISSSAQSCAGHGLPDAYGRYLRIPQARRRPELSIVAVLKTFSMGSRAKHKILAGSHVLLASFWKRGKCTGVLSDHTRRPVLQQMRGTTGRVSDMRPCAAAKQGLESPQLFFLCGWFLTTSCETFINR